MMTTLHKDERGKGPKKTFAPPAQKLHSLMPYSLNSRKEETLGISSREIEARPNLLKARLEKKEKKATTEDGASSGQEKKVKAQDNKQADKKEKEIWDRVCRVLMCDHCFHALNLMNLLPHVKESFLTGQRGELGKKQFFFHTPSLQEKSSLTNEEFEEIVQIVLQKSLQQCLETSCVQSIRCTQLDKEPGNALSTTDNDNADRERVMVPHILEISASQEDGIIPEIKTSKPGQPDPASSEKKFSKLSLSKRNEKAQDEKMKKAQSGHEHRQKDQPKKVVQGHPQTRDQQKGEESGFGQCLVWVQCSSPNCEKWRQLRGNIDPSVLPDTWSCDQNTDLEYNRCDIPEETWTGCESEVAYASYIPGSIIWAKQYGYPWWPGMVECDPDLGEYFLFASHLDSLPSKYHVTFFGEIVSRAWIPVNMLKNFQELSLELAGVKKCRNKDCSQKLRAAMIMAQEAEQISIQERVKLFGFWSRYNGSTKDTMDHTGEGKDLMLSGAKGPVSSLEKEEESDLEKKKEGKKDPTLPSPKPTKTQTKKPKARRIADRRDGAQQRKSMNGSLGDEPAASPVPIKGRKEVHRNSDPDQPGPKKKFKGPQSKVSAIGLSEEKEVRMVPKGLTLPTHHRAWPAMGKEGPGPQELQEAGSFLPDDETSSDLDLEQLMEDVGKKPEPRVELRHRADTEEFTFFEE